MTPLNLASQPFRNQRLSAVLLGTGAVVLLVITVAHALVLRRVLPGRTSTLHRQVDRLEREAGVLRDQAREMRAPRPDATTLAEWNRVKELVDKRAFSWTGLFAVLEEALPGGVRLVSVAPHTDKAGLALHLTAQARSWNDGLEFLHILQERPEFADVKPIGRTEGEPTGYQYQMTYRPEAAGTGPRAVAVQSSAAAPPSPVPAGPEDLDR